MFSKTFAKLDYVRRVARCLLHLSSRVTENRNHIDYQMKLVSEILEKQNEEIKELRGEIKELRQNDRSICWSLDWDYHKIIELRDASSASVPTPSTELPDKCWVGGCSYPPIASDIETETVADTTWGNLA